MTAAYRQLAEAFREVTEPGEPLTEEEFERMETLGEFRMSGRMPTWRCDGFMFVYEARTDVLVCNFLEDNLLWNALLEPRRAPKWEVRFLNEEAACD